MTILHVLLMVNIWLILKCQYYFTFTTYPKTLSYYVCLIRKHHHHPHTHMHPTHNPPTPMNICTPQLHTHTHTHTHTQTHTHTASIRTSRIKSVYITKVKWQMPQEKMGADYEKWKKQIHCVSKRQMHSNKKLHFIFYLQCSLHCK